MINYVVDSIQLQHWNWLTNTYIDIKLTVFKLPTPIYDDYYLFTKVTSD